MLDQPDIRARIQAIVARALIDLPRESFQKRVNHEVCRVEGAINFALEIGAITSDERVEFFNQLKEVI